MHKYTNQLINETSPYLLQHAHNPVQWYPWNEEALARAIREDKPILVSIGYSACHWCHVMEKESFEDEATAQLMNEHFINIKIDREERPDLDHIYMDAVQAMTGSGGWPLNVFLTPDKKPFYGGTYFPPVPAFNRSSWKDLLNGIATAFQERRSEIEQQAQQMTEHLNASNAFGLQKPGPLTELLSPDKILQAHEQIMASADTVWGGFGNAPKFPQTFTIQFLLRFVSVAQNLFGEEHQEKKSAALNQALLSLDKMIDGGIYDQVGGGFARYSTDKEWLAPHFEKMLYDNALLIDVLSEAYQLTGIEKYRQTIDETMQFLRREMLEDGRAFYSALDADSEGEEGKYYVWSEEEIKQVLGTDAAIFSQYYDISKTGNWEEKNILRVLTPIEKFASQHGLTTDELSKTLSTCKQKLLQVRTKRTRPSLDDKIILGWNALMNTACSKAFGATGNEEYRQLAITNMHFLLGEFNDKEDKAFYHTWKKGQAKYSAFLDDYAYLVQALIHLQEITGDTEWLLRAREITVFVEEHFSEQGSGLFYYTKDGQDDVIVRKKELYDGAVPSGNAVMAGNLYYLGIMLDETVWRERSLAMLGTMGQVMSRYPISFGVWCMHLLGAINGFVELVIIGPDNEPLANDLLKKHLPYKVLMTSKKVNQDFPLMTGKATDANTQVFVCKDYACYQPVKTIEEVMLLINSMSRKN